uniref:DNA-directed RNA polymerase II subunit GRINL1A n=1 Tax=Sphenodon punctatus TaxID=8508 RepID=A0A8D0HK90_SPHPU
MSALLPSDWGGSGRSLPELRELLKRQERLLRDRGLEEREPEKEQNAKDHPFGSLSHKMPKKPNYIEVLESRAKNPVVKKEKFKTNTGSLISPEERRLRDKKHLDDITSARIPPLHHTPAQLLSIEESIAIQKQQKEVYEEMQAKLAAQKLAEKLNIKMVSYEPEGEMSMKYKEIRDEEDNDSSE